MNPVTIPMCPRCGYDLSGEVARWDQQCPLHGRCSECGLDFAWGDVVSDRLRPPRWSFEHARSWWLVRVPRGLAAGLRPFRCWRALVLEHRLVATRLVGALLCMLAGLWVVAGVVSCVAATRISFVWWGGGTAGTPRMWLEVAWQEHRGLLFMPIIQGSLFPLELWRGPLVGAWTATLSGACVAMPLGFLLLPQTLRRTRVRRAHLLRAAVYSMGGPALCLVVGISVVGWFVDSSWVLLFGWCAAAVGIWWLLASWWGVTVIYLRLPQARAVWLAMSIIALLSGAVAGAMLLPGEMHEYRWVWYL